MTYPYINEISAFFRSNGEINPIWNDDYHSWLADLKDTGYIIIGCHEGKDLYGLPSFDYPMRTLRSILDGWRL